MNNLKKPLTPAQKKKGEILLKSCPKGWLETFGVSSDFKTVGDLRAAVEVFALHLTDLPDNIADRIYARLYLEDEEAN